MSRTETLRRRWLRPTAFRSGILAGLGAFGLVSLLTYLLIFWPNPEPDFNVEVISHGVDVDRYGGREITVGTHRVGVFLKATCRDGCDDIWYRTRPVDEEAYAARVLDASGACVACGTAGYVTRGPFSGLERWTFAGDVSRAGQPRNYRLNRDGTLRSGF